MCLSDMVRTSFKPDPPLNSLPLKLLLFILDFPNIPTSLVSSLAPFFFLHPLAHSASSTEQREQ